MKTIVFTTTTLLALSMSAAAFATTNTAAQSGFFIKAGGGVGQLESPVPNSYVNINVPGMTISGSDTGPAWDVGAGYQFALNQTFSLGAEVDYFQLGTASSDINVTGIGSTFDMTNTAVEALLDGTVWLSNGFHVFANVGSASVTQKITGTDNFGIVSVPYSQTLEQTLPVFGLGAGYQFTPYLGAQLAWQHVFGTGTVNFNDSSSSDVSQSDTYTLDVVVTLPT